jgi:PhzF family phenazine biosynthesis protein
MKLELYQIDAFTDKIFGGNPACVVPLESWLPDETLHQIARENAVAETAFFIQQGERIHLRWFTPEIEMDLCGHATLAAAYCLKELLGYKGEVIHFQTLSGELTVTTNGQLYILDFPSRMPTSAALPPNIYDSLNIKPIEVYQSRDYVLVYGSEADIRNIKINSVLFDQINLDPGGIVVTAPGDECDFVSRFFTPQASILEDPVTGSAHCSLIPFWAKRLNKKNLYARQISERSGTLYCEEKGDRVLISGQAVVYSAGHIWIP